MRLLRLIALSLLAAAGLAFIARLLKPQPVLRDVEGDLGYIGPSPADGPTVSVSDAIPLGLPGPRTPADQVTPVG